MRTIHTERAPRAIGPYSQAVEAGGFLFTAGQIGLDPRTGELVSDGVEDQAKQVLENLGAILSSSGLTPADVVKTTVYLVDMNDFPRVNAIYGSWFAEPYPARATVAVAALPAGALVEIDLVAHTGE